MVARNAQKKNETAGDKGTGATADVNKTPPTFKTKRKLVMPLLKLQPGVPIYIIPLEARFTGRDISKNETDEKKKRNPAELCNVVDLVSGDEVQIIVPAVLQSVWDDEYPDGGYVGLGFQIIKGSKAPGKNYFTYSVDEIELPE